MELGTNKFSMVVGNATAGSVDRRFMIWNIDGSNNVGYALDNQIYSANSSVDIEPTVATDGTYSYVFAKLNGTEKFLRYHNTTTARTDLTKSSDSPALSGTIYLDFEDFTKTLFLFMG